MRRRRAVFSRLSAISVVFLALTIALWIASYVHPTAGYRGAPLHNGATERSDDWGWHWQSALGDLRISPVNSFYVWQIPYWQLSVFFGALPAWFVIDKLRKDTKEMSS